MTRNDLAERSFDARASDEPDRARNDAAGPSEPRDSELSNGRRYAGVPGLLRWYLIRVVRRPTVGAMIGTGVVFAFFAVAAGGHGFTGLNGTATWLNQSAELAIVAVPVGLLMIGGEFDLSIASVIGLGSLTVSIGAGHYGIPLIASIVIALVLAGIVGAINGVVTVRTGLPSFIVTLATYLGLDGATLYATRRITTTTDVGVTSTGWVHSVFAGSSRQFNVSILWCLAVALIAGLVMSRTVFGSWVTATGGDKAAAGQAGVPTNRVKVTLFVCSSLGAALLGIIQALEYNGGQVGQGQSYIFYAIVAAVIGGVLLQGGYGSALGVVFGAMTYGIVNTGIYYTGWDADLAEVFIGLLVLLAVLTNNVFRHLATRD